MQSLLETPSPLLGQKLYRLLISKRSLASSQNEGCYCSLGKVGLEQVCFIPKQLASFSAFFIGELPHMLELTQWASIWLPNVLSATLMLKQIFPFFFYCNFALEWWFQFLQVFGQPLLHPPSPGQLQYAFSTSEDGIGRKIVATVFFHLISSIWYALNEATFNNNWISPTQFRRPSFLIPCVSRYICKKLLTIDLKKAISINFLYYQTH